MGPSLRWEWHRVCGINHALATPTTVIPAKAGTQLSPASALGLSTIPPQAHSQRKLGPSSHLAQVDEWVPAFAGMTIGGVAPTESHQKCTNFPSAKP